MQSLFFFFFLTIKSEWMSLRYHINYERIKIDDPKNRIKYYYIQGKFHYFVHDWVIKNVLVGLKQHCWLTFSGFCFSQTFHIFASFHLFFVFIYLMQLLMNGKKREREREREEKKNIHQMKVKRKKGKIFFFPLFAGRPLIYDQQVTSTTR